MEQNRDPGIELPVNIVNLSLTAEQRQDNGANTVFLTNAAGVIGHLLEKE